VDINTVYMKFDGNPYRALTYDQTRHLSANYYRDYNKTLTGNAATDAFYYGFNRVSSEDVAVLANVDYRIAEGQHLVFKPYYWSNDGEQWNSAGSQIQIWRQQNENIGGVLEYDG